MSRSALVRACGAAALVMGGALPSTAQHAPQFAIDLASSAWLSGGVEWRSERLRIQTLDGEARSTLFRVGRLNLGSALRGQYDRLTDGSAYTRMQADMRFSTRSPLRGLSVGAGVSASSAPRYRFATTTARVGGWVRTLGLSISGEITAGHLPVLVSRDSEVATLRDSGATPVFLPVEAHRTGGFATEARLAMSTRLGGVYLDGYAGRFLVTRARGSSYGAIMATEWVSPRLAVMAGTAFRPIDPGSGLGRAVALFGVRLAPRGSRSRFVEAPPAGATGVIVTRTGELVTIAVHAPGASSVEIAGDFTRWNPVSLDRSRGGRWTLTTRLQPGVYRVNVRVDEGEWSPPPGVSRTVDPYEGMVGVLVVS